VQPSRLIQELREEALRQHPLAAGLIADYEALCAQLQRVRWQLMAHLIRRQSPASFVSHWGAWAEAPVEPLRPSPDFLLPWPEMILARVKPQSDRLATRSPHF
jgi:hypothetical protein